VNKPVGMSARTACSTIPSRQKLLLYLININTLFVVIVIPEPSIVRIKPVGCSARRSFEMGNLSVEEEVAGHLIRRLDEEESLQILRNLPDRLRDLSVKHRSFTEVKFQYSLKDQILTYAQTQRWDEIANLQSENGTIVESG